MKIKAKKKLIKFLSHRHWDYSKLHLKKKTIDTVEELIDNSIEYF